MPFSKKHGTHRTLKGVYADTQCRTLSLSLSLPVSCRNIHKHIYSTHTLLELVYARTVWVLRPSTSTESLHKGSMVLWTWADPLTMRPSTSFCLSFGGDGHSRVFGYQLVLSSDITDVFYRGLHMDATRISTCARAHTAPHRRVVLLDAFTACLAVVFPRPCCC